MTLNEELRRMLNEREVEWEAFDVFEQTTQWSTYNGAFVYWARERDGKLLVETTAPTKCSASCTPGQAIVATLGAGTCHVETTESWLPAERYHRCKNCGAFFAVLDASGDIPPRVCPNCGRRVV